MGRGSWRGRWANARPTGPRCAPRCIALPASSLARAPAWPPKSRGLWPARYDDGVGLVPVLAALLTLVGIGLTSFGALTHTATAIAPGATLAFLGGGWLGNSLARQRGLDMAGPPEKAE